MKIKLKLKMKINILTFLFILLNYNYSSSIATQVKIEPTINTKSSDGYSTPFMSEKNLMNQARLAFENNKLEQARKLYEKIPQSSDFWLESIEERAWTHLRLNQTSEALALIQTLTSDLVSPEIGPEPYFLYAMTQYKLCDVKGVFSALKLFKTRFQNRTSELKKLQKDGNNKATVGLFEKLKVKLAAQKAIKADDIGSNIQFLPHYFYRDRSIKSYLNKNDQLRFEYRMSQLSTQDITEIESLLVKMHLLESQIVQQVFAFEKELSQQRNAEFAKQNDKNNLVFPVSSETWIDEIDGFEASTIKCPIDPFNDIRKN